MLTQRSRICRSTNLSLSLSISLSRFTNSVDVGFQPEDSREWSLGTLGLLVLGQAASFSSYLQKRPRPGTVSWSSCVLIRGRQPSPEQCVADSLAASASHHFEALMYCGKYTPSRAVEDQ